MMIHVTVALRKARASLQSEKANLERQITAIETVLAATNQHRRGWRRTVSAVPRRVRLVVAGGGG